MICGVPVAACARAQIPRLANGKPDLNGVWERPYVPDMTRTAATQKGTAPLPFTSEGAEGFKNYDPAKFDYTGNCRVAPTDGRKCPTGDDLDPTWNNVRTFTLRKDGDIMEYSCLENNKDLKEGHIT